MMTNAHFPGHTAQPRAFTLVELLVVCLIITILMVVLIQTFALVRDRSMRTACVSRLRQVGQAFIQYRGECRKFPAAAPPEGFGDRANWYDLWGHIDPYNIVFSSATGPGGIMNGNRTEYPRIPRLLEGYTGDVTVLHCNSQGASNWWYDVGPYWYNTTSPFATGSSEWAPYVNLPIAKSGDPLSACQSPTVVFSGLGTWRHGVKKNCAPGGLNNHLFAPGNVKTFDNPVKWRTP